MEINIADKIHAQGRKAGLSIKPGTALETLKPYLNDFDLFPDHECRTRLWRAEIHAGSR
jgi:hypothetical protein